MDNTTWLGLGATFMLLFWGLLWGPDAINADHRTTDCCGRTRETKIGFWALLAIVVLAWLYAEAVMKDGALFRELKNLKW